MILIIGANGFVGSHVLDALLSSNSAEIVITRRSSSNFQNISHIPFKDIKVFNLNEHDIPHLFKKYPIDTIINTAISYGRNKLSSIDVLESNLILPIRMIEEGIKHKLKCFVNADSYFNKNNLSYSHLLNYSVSKRSLLIWLKYYSSSIKIINLMLEHVYGPRDSEEKFVAKIINDVAVKQIEKFDMTHGHQLRDFIYVKDVARAFVRTLEISRVLDFGFREYEVGTGKCTQLREFAEIIRRLSKSNTHLNFGAIPYRRDEIMSSYADNRELINLGWSPEFQLEQGLREMVRSNRGPHV